MKPNPQQQQAIDHVDGPCLVTAVPGSGKTAAMTERIRRLVQLGKDPVGILAITFTNKAAKEMKTRIARAAGEAAASKMTICTIHSLCARILRQYCLFVGLDKDFTIYDEDSQKRLLSHCALRVLDPNAPDRPQRGRKSPVTADYYAQLRNYAECKRNSCLTEQEAIQRSGADARQAQICEAYFKELRKWNAVDFTGLLSEAVRLFEENPKVLEDYRRRFSYISVDEVQDTNKAQYRLISLLAGEHKNIFMIGDVDQCLPSDAMIDTKGGKQPISLVRKGDLVCSATGNGHWGYGLVLKSARREYKGPLLRIKTKGGKVLKVTPNHVLYARVPALPGAYIVYLMYRQDKGFRVGRTTGMRKWHRNRTSNGLTVRATQEHADGCWILKICSSASEASYYESFYSIKYGIPTTCFHVIGRRLAMTQEYIDALFANIDSRSGASRLMQELQIDERYLHLPKSSCNATGRLWIQFNSFGERGGHSVSIHGQNDIKRIAEQLGLHCARSKAAHWRICKLFNSYAAADAFAQKLASAIPKAKTVKKATLCQKGSKHETVLMEMPASHIHPKMLIATRQNGSIAEDEVVEVSSEDYDGQVYDLTIQDTANFISDGVVCHNSIYAFRDAQPRNVIAFEQDFGAKVLKLELNYRSTPEILRRAQQLIEHNKLRKETVLATENPGGDAPRSMAYGTEEQMAEAMASQIVQFKQQGIPAKEIAVFFRVNHVSRILELALRARGIKYKVIGGTSFWKRKEVKACLAILSVLCNPKDRASFENAAEACCMGIGPKAFDAIGAAAQALGGNMLEAARQFASKDSAQARALAPFTDAVTSSQVQPADERLLLIAHRTSFWAWMREDSHPDNDRCANITELAGDLGRTLAKGGSLSSYLQEMALLSDSDEESSEDEVKLMTLHGCKGLEFDVVFISHANQGIVPHYRTLALPFGPAKDLQMEEERRLFYVGMTRARKYLRILHCRARQGKGKGYDQLSPSMFIAEAGL